MNFSSIFLSIIFHTGIFLSLITFFNPELRQRTKIQHDLVSFQIIENDLFEKQKQNKIFDCISQSNDSKAPILLNLSIKNLSFKNSSLDSTKKQINKPGTDLKSRLKTFYYVSILNPDDEMVKIILTKLLHEKQFIIKNPEIFEFLVKRIERSYQSIYNIVDKLDKFSLEKKRQLTIPLIKEIL